MKFDYGVSILLLAISVFVYFESQGFRGGGLGDPGAGFMPQVISVLLALLSIGLFFQTYKEKNKKNNNSSKITLKDIKNIILVMLGLIMYYYTLRAIGFIILTPILMMYLIYLFNKKISVKAAIFSIILTSALYFVFGGWLNIPIPTMF
ncbi:tripartite tricarboxylate transporter TctB family protein [Halarsenatibacter silvermanii]|uniref:Tripartite tricarboxylate transporter TctB family protein n=1 Tax=Halarsenatibacter silvermanii TaxID=321763 RepID=A0A1G9TWG5_9FIRM|nr:tripartite tricarboxylate transporter TctB family protein [Halarsenatibacter silvermanii]SDM52096.1 Tripartite tricarboxylate transporter TctB family protein [Halarsenatibacter silvermanii]